MLSGEMRSRCAVNMPSAGGWTTRALSAGERRERPSTEKGRAARRLPNGIPSSEDGPFAGIWGAPGADALTPSTLTRGLGSHEERSSRSAKSRSDHNPDSCSLNAVASATSRVAGGESGARPVSPTSGTSPVMRSDGRLVAACGEHSTSDSRHGDAVERNRRSTRRSGL